MASICKHCGIEYNINTPSHYRSCGKYNIFIEEVKKVLTREFLIEEYEIKQRSAANISKELGLDKTRLVKLKLKEYGIIERVSPKDFANAKHRQELTKEASLITYGVSHHLMAHEIINKRTETIKKKYGVDHIFKSDVIKERQRNTLKDKYGFEYVSQIPKFRKKVSDTNLKRYGVSNPWLSSDIQRKCVETKISKGLVNGYVSSASQKFITQVYERLPQCIKNDCYFATLNKEFGTWGDNSYLTYDFVIPTLKYCMEYNGTYFHADPTVYPEDWVNKKMGLTAKQIWEKDAKKNQFMIDRGFTVDVVWQREEEETTIERIVATILSMVDD